MSSPRVTVALASVVGGLLGGATVHLAGNRDSAADKRPRVEREESAPTSQEGEREVGSSDESQLKEQVRKLEHRVALLSSALQKEHQDQLAEGSSEEQAETGSQKNEVTDVADPVFEAAVLDILDREGARKTEEQAAYRKQLHQERGRRYASELQASLALSDDQQAAIAQTVSEYFEHMRALRDQNAENRPATRKEWRKLRKEMNAAADTKLRSILDSEQYQKYQALDAEDQLGWGRRSGNQRGDQGRRQP